jgi:hypothetical protein
MKKVAIVTSHFPPSNLASVHRSRLWAMFLPEYGWHPVILTCHHRYYEEKLDYPLLQTLPKWLRVIRVPAFKTKPIRIVGDAGVRVFFWIYKALVELVQRERIDFVLITIPSNYLAPIGPLIKARFGIPFGIDYIDPWVHDWPGSSRPGSKHWFSRKLADLLEPCSVENSDLITGINYYYFSGMLERNPAVVRRAYLASMPYGVAQADFIHASNNQNSHLIAKIRKKNNWSFDKIWVYAGAFLPKSEEIYVAIFKALKFLKEQKRLPAEGLKMIFLGTGKSPNDTNGYQVFPLAGKFGVDELVYEIPNRVSYSDVISCLSEANGVLVIGSVEKHYSPSKIYQALMSGRPVWAALHKDSSAWSFLEKKWGCEGIKFEDGRSIDILSTAESLEKAFQMKRDYTPEREFLNDSEMNAKNSAKSLAHALNATLALINQVYK